MFIRSQSLCVWNIEIYLKHLWLFDVCLSSLGASNEQKKTSLEHILCICMINHEKCWRCKLATAMKMVSQSKLAENKKNIFEDRFCSFLFFARNTMQTMHHATGFLIRGFVHRIFKLVFLIRCARFLSFSAFRLHCFASPNNKLCSQICNLVWM